MSEDYTITPIAHIQSDYKEKFGIPRQSGLVEGSEARIVFTLPFRNADALRGIEGFSHLWLIWQFSQNVRENWSPTVRPPRLGGNERLGVFATRSPFRPNALGLSCVRLAGVEKTADCGTVLTVQGADLMDGTPIYDIKPYIAYTDAHVDAQCSYASAPPEVAQVDIPEDILPRIPADKLSGLVGTLAGDPRPRYQHDEQRVYSMDYASMCVRFCVKSGVVHVVDVAERWETERE